MFFEGKYNDRGHTPIPPDSSPSPIGSELPGRPKHPEHPEKPGKPIPITVVVNGVDTVLPEKTKKLSYEDVIKLAYPNYNGDSNIIYTVVFSNGPAPNKKGTLVKGDFVHIQEGMIFNVGKSNKS